MLGVRYSREVAAVYYLNQGWEPAMGGHFVDLQARCGAALCLCFSTPACQPRPRGEAPGAELLHSAALAAHSVALQRGAAAAELLRLAAGAQDPERHVRHAPTFNSLVAFRVPRWHAVEHVAPGPHARLSVFGWWLTPGMRYPLHGAQQVAYS